MDMFGLLAVGMIVIKLGMLTLAPSIVVSLWAVSEVLGFELKLGLPHLIDLTFSA